MYKESRYEIVFFFSFCFFFFFNNYMDTAGGYIHPNNHQSINNFGKIRFIVRIESA